MPLKLVTYLIKPTGTEFLLITWSA